MGNDVLHAHFHILILFGMHLGNEGIIKGDNDQMPQMWRLLFNQAGRGDI